MKTATVYRMENDKGVGPYSGLSCRWQNVEHLPETGRPGPHNDNIPIQALKNKYGKKALFFGFANKKTALRWFTKVERRRLAEVGFTLKKMVGEIVGRGSRQVVFIRKC